MADTQRIITNEDFLRRYNLQDLKKNSKIIQTLDQQLTNTYGIIKDYITVMVNYESKEQYFLSGVPTLENLPASEWTTPGNHLNTIYYDVDNGKAYIFKYDEEYYWEELNDSSLLNILSIANGQTDTANDNIRRVFYEQPTVPYSAGDIWINGSNIYRCKRGELEGGTYHFDDWVDYTQYKEEMASSNAIRQLNKFKETVETEYVTTAVLEAAEDEINASVTRVENVAKSKNKVFTSEPTTPYYRGDSYIKQVTDEQTGITMNLIYVCQTSRETGNYNPDDFSLQPSYATSSQLLITDNKVDIAVAKIGTDPTVHGTILQNISSLTTRIGAVEAQVSEIADITKSSESVLAFISDSDLQNIAESEPIYIEIHPINENISYLYPNTTLNPSDNLFLKVRLLKITNTSTDETFMYEIPDNLLYYDENTYDEFVLDYQNQYCEIIKKCKYNADGSVGLLDTERVDTYTYPIINLSEGNYQFELLGYDTGYLKVRLMAVNAYTDQYATKIELNSKITAEANRIDAKVEENVTELSGEIDTISGELELKVGKNENNQIVSMLNAAADEITLAGGSKINITTAGKLLISAGNFQLDSSGNMTCTNGTFSGSINTGNGKFVVDSNGNMTCNNGTLNNGTFSGSITAGKIDVGGYTENNPYITVGYPDDEYTPYATFIWDNGISVIDFRGDGVNYPCIRTEQAGGGFAQLYGNHVDAFAFNNVSQEDKKKNFEKLENGLEIIKNTDIYKYNFKFEEDDDKKHIGLVIGNKYKYSKELTNKDNTGVDTYAMVSVCFKAIQEQQKMIEDLQNELKSLKEEKEND